MSRAAPGRVTVASQTPPLPLMKPLSYVKVTSTTDLHVESNWKPDLGTHHLELVLERIWGHLTPSQLEPVLRD